MSRTGVEDKPSWRRVPLPVRRLVADALGAPVDRSTRVWGGYGPTATFRLRLRNGDRAFFKAVNSESNNFMRAAFGREERVYRELGAVIGRWAPRFLGSLDRDDWRVLLLEDLGPKSAPPWTPLLARRVLGDYALFHAATVGAALPDWLPRTAERMEDGGRLWTWAERERERRSLAALAGAREEEAWRWLNAAIPVLARMSARLPDPAFTQALLHGDARSDNLRWVSRGLVLVDWPHVSMGPPEDDLAMFAQTITVDGGPEPEQLVEWYGRHRPVDPAALDAALAALAGFFASQAWLPDVPGLPRLREFQRQQLRVTLAWAARRLGLAPPTWVDALPAACHAHHPAAR